MNATNDLPPVKPQPAPPVPPYTRPQTPPPPDDYLVWAILTTLFCCLPLGIGAIIYSVKVNTLWYQGHYEAARAAALSAKNWSFWAGLAGAFLYLLGFAGWLLCLPI